MSLLSVVQSVCQVVGVEQLATVLGNLNAERTQQEMLALANEMARRIAFDTRDWTTLTTSATFAGDGVTTSFPMPANFRRMLVDGNLWLSSAPNIPATFIPSYDEWLRRTMTGYWPFTNSYTFNGGNLLIQPPLGVGVSASLAFIENRIINNVVANTVTDTFMNDADTFRLDERLLRLGMIWQWKANKGSPYAEDMGTYQDAIMNVMGRDKPAPIIVGNMPLSQAIITSSYPWPLPTP